MEEPPLSPGPSATMAPGAISKAVVDSPDATDTTAGGSVAGTPASPATPAISLTSSPRLPTATKRSSCSPSGKSLLNLSSFPSSPAYSFRPPLRLGPPNRGRKSPATPASAPTCGGSVARSASQPCVEVRVNSPKRTPRAASPREVLKVTPGPGSYEARSCMGKGPRAVLPPKRCPPVLTAQETQRLRVVFGGPGPGAYEARSCIGVGAGPKFPVTPTCRGVRNPNLAPGPGDYDAPSSTLRISGSLKWGSPSTQRRIQSHRVGDAPSPGPAAHVATSTSVGEGPKFSFGRSLREQPRSGTPGPGAYGGLYTTFRMQSPSNCRSGVGGAPAAG